MARELAITTADGKKQALPLEGNQYSLGRSVDNELCYADDVGLSRRHMLLERFGEEWTVRDLGSKNGTFVNGERLSQPHRLRPGDRIVASRVCLTFEPAETALDKTVLFEGVPAPTGATVSTTLERLLSGNGVEIQPTPGQPPTQWGTPIAALMRAGRELAERRPLCELFQVILDLSIEAVGAQRGVLLTLERERLAVQASRGESFRISTAVRDRVVEGKTSVLIQDIRQDEALRNRGSIVSHGVRTLMAAPLQTDDRVIGLIYVDTPQLLREFSVDDLNLLTVMANVAAIRIERERLSEVEQVERIMAAELQQAAEIQRRFLPESAPSMPGVDLAGYNAPCRTVGGDYYDFLLYPDGKVAVVIGDVAGKGMPAALMMTCLQSKVHAITETACGPATAVTRLNRSLAATCPGNRFVTLFFCVLDPQSGELIYCNAGHNPPLLIRKDGEVLRLESGGPVLGLLPELSFEEDRCCLEAGEVLLLYSDGVTEATAPDGEEFGEDRLIEILKQHAHDSADAIMDAVHDAVESWYAGSPVADDITVVVARRTAE